MQTEFADLEARHRAAITVAEGAEEARMRRCISETMMVKVK